MAPNPMIGLLAPPLGINLFIVDKISEVSSLGKANACQPFFVPLAVGSRLMALLPPLATLLTDPFGVNYMITSNRIWSPAGQTGKDNE